MRVLVTGATGFVGSHLCPALLEEGHQVTAAVRRVGVLRPNPGIREIAMCDFGPNSDWREALEDVEIVMHIAGRAHVMRERAADAEAAYQRINVKATSALAAQAAASGVKRLIFLSSVKAAGEQSVSRTPLRIDMTPQPLDAYGRTKLLAESALAELCQRTGLETVILRSPLIYGPGMKGNSLSLFNAVDKGMPLPLRLVDNLRDLIFVGNLVAAMIHTLGIPAHRCGSYYVCDGEAVSVAELIRRIAKALDRPVRLWPVPLIFLKLAGAISGRSESIKRLTQSLQIDGNTFCQRVDWAQPYTMKEGLAQTAAWYNGRQMTY